MNIKEWSTEFPQKPGFYWFYGDPHQGGMGCDFRDNAPPIVPQMQLMEVIKISNGVMGVCEGHFFPKNKFNKTKKQAGYVGYFAKAKLPNPPKDINNYFK